ncbi:SRPBCC domain-containing protein [Hamadaea sp.]|uniref:SRPBCC domain-containing protein n=1 Tax=Hamadaea sp. TaxID=2024425 RepID=UPI0025BEFD4E|nr:SRPBCC domain-containing protein [Hamadaea sp.]
MSEISVDVDLPHPPHRVWRALTDRRVLATWFMQTDLEALPGAVGRAFPSGIPGFTGPFDIEVVSVGPERLLVMRWRGDQLHVEVRWELEELTGGTRLRVSQTGFLGVNGTLRRRELRRAYQQLFGEELPAVLDRAVTGEPRVIPRQRVQQPVVAAVGVENELPSAAPRDDLSDPSDPWALSDPSVMAGVGHAPTPVDEDSLATTAPPHGFAGRLATAFPLQERVRAAAITVTVALIVVTVGWLWLTRPVHVDAPSDAYPVATHEPGINLPAQSPFVLPSGAPTGAGTVAPSTTGTPGVSASPSGSPTVETSTSGTPPVQPALTAEYATQSSTGLLGYKVAVTVTVHNPGTSPHSGWTVVLTVPSGATVDSNSGSVQVSKSGGQVTITPKDGSKVVNSGSDVAFIVTFSGGALLGIGSGGVTGCTVDGVTCTKA